MEDVYLQLDPLDDYHYDHGESNLIGYNMCYQETPNIDFKDYFNEECNYKTLHNFQNSKKGIRLGVCNLDLLAHQSKQCFERIKLTSNSSMPEEPESVTTPNGDVYFFGGAYYNQSNQVVRQSDEIFKLDWQRKVVKKIGQMSLARYKHGVCLIGDFIYIVGGYNLLDQGLTIVERYDITKNKCEVVSSLQKPAYNLSCTSFNDRYIYKFYGQESTHKVSKYVERYDVETDKWSTVDVVISPENGNAKEFSMTFKSGCVQVNSTQIFIFGGKDQKFQDTSLSYLFTPHDELLESSSRIVSSTATVDAVNMRPLPKAGWIEGQPIVHEHSVYALQMVEWNNDIISFLMKYDGHGWIVCNGGEEDGYQSNEKCQVM